MCKIGSTILRKKGYMRSDTYMMKSRNQPASRCLFWQVCLGNTSKTPTLQLYTPGVSRYSFYFLTRYTARACFLAQLCYVSVEDAEPIVWIIWVLWPLGEILAARVKLAGFEATLPWIGSLYLNLTAFVCFYHLSITARIKNWTFSFDFAIAWTPN